MLNMVALMMCRNPSFDLLGIFSHLKENILRPLFSQWKDEKKETFAVENLMRVLWLNEMYKSLFNVEDGFVDSFLSSAMSNLGMVVFRVRSDDGGCFITSDSPVVSYTSFVESQNRNGIYFPLNPEFLLFFGKRSDGNIGDAIFCTLGADEVKKINRIIFHSSNRGIVSTSRHLRHIL